MSSANLASRFGRLKLLSPIVVGACPMTADERIRGELQDAGVGAIVLPSLFQEQVIQWNEKNGKGISGEEARVLERSKRSMMDSFCDDAETYLSMVNRASVLSSVPIIASLNGEVGGNWLDFAGELQEVGASAIELNVRMPPPTEYDRSQDAESKIQELVSTIGESVTVPVNVKISPEFTSVAHLATRLLSGANGMVLFAGSPIVDIDLGTLQLRPSWELTQGGSIISKLASIMRIHAFCPAMPLAACGGIATADDVLKTLLAGADVAMVTSAIYRDGANVVRLMNEGLKASMAKHNWGNMGDLQAARPLEFSTEAQRLLYIQSLADRHPAVVDGT